MHIVVLVNVSSVLIDYSSTHEPLGTTVLTRDRWSNTTLDETTRRHGRSWNSTTQTVTVKTLLMNSFETLSHKNGIGLPRTKYNTTMSPEPELMTGLGAAAAMFFSALGSALASLQGGKYAMRSTGVLSFVPIVISGVLAIYGIIVAVLLSGKMGGGESADGYRNFSAGLSVGLACLASGLGMAGFLEDSLSGNTATVSNVADDDVIRAPLVRNNTNNARMIEQPSIRFLMCLCFIEAIGLYGLIVALFLIGH